MSGAATDLTYYFAFGSNMCSARFIARIPKGRSLWRARLEGWRFVCNKRGDDGSAKANIMRSAKGTVWGVVYRLPVAALTRLDAIEGGYERIAIEVEHGDRRIAAVAYASTLHIDGSVPFDWYRRHIVEGAKEHGLPADYQAFLRTLPQRSSRE